MKKLYAAIGIDCDPDRDTPPNRLTWRGIENIARLSAIDGIRWTFNIRADSQVKAYHGRADFCYREYRDIWDQVRRDGSAIALHLHYFGSDNRQNTAEDNIEENIRLGVEALEGPDIVHMGWTFQNDFSIKKLAEAGIKIDYSPLPKMNFTGKSGVDSYDWSGFAYEPTIWHGVKMIPAYTCKSRLLSLRHHSERVMMTTATRPMLYNILLRDFFRDGHDFFVSYFHIDEIISALGGWRKHLYSFENLRANIDRLKDMAAKNGYEIEFVNIRELAGVLFK